MKDVIAVFDVGKTNKKILLFDEALRVRFQEEKAIPVKRDDDDFECDDLDAVESWLKSTLLSVINNRKYRVKAVNFTTYGATIVYLDEHGHRLGEAYNYLKPMPEGITDRIYERYGGVEEFSRRTASPALGMLNSGMQILWLREKKPELFRQTKTILHLPQYLSYLFTGKVCSEYTSIGCHTAMWDFDNMRYHPWLADENISLPEPVPNNEITTVHLDGQELLVGIGIHDSSASLAPYIMGSQEKFLLLSTGTWCINMNPFNHEPLTREQLNKDCLCYMSISQQPVKSSRLFMGYIHDVNIKRISEHFRLPETAFHSIAINENLLVKYAGTPGVFFREGIPDDFVDRHADLSMFSSFREAYHRFMVDLTELCLESIRLVIPASDDIGNVFVSGGFARNEIFVRYLASRLKNKKIYTSYIDNATALGAALVIYEQAGFRKKSRLDLGLKLWKPVRGI